jgi:hypothetical protein
VIDKRYEKDKEVNMGFETLCVTLIALLVGLAICFNGYRWFLILLPIWGFFWGFALGAQALQAVFGIGFLATVTSWVAGFIVGAIFAVLSYLFYLVAVALMAGSLGYGLGVGIMGLIGFDFGLITWLVAIGLAIVVAAVTIYFNLYKYVIIVTTAIGGAGTVVITLMFGYAGLTLANLAQNPIRFALQGSPLWTILFLVLAVLGIVSQLATSRAFELEPYESRI